MADDKTRGEMTQQVPEHVRDALDDAIADVARAGGHRADAITTGHLGEELVIAHLQRQLDPTTRARVVSHLASCELCLERVANAADLLRVDVLESEPGRVGAAPALDIGPALMRVAVAVEASALRVVSTDAEMRVGWASAMRHRRAAGGVAFRRTSQYGDVRLELLEARRGRVSLSVMLTSAPAGGRVSVIAGGRLLETRPLRDGQAIVRDLPVRSTYLRLEAPGVVLGHVHLALRPSSDEHEESR